MMVHRRSLVQSPGSAPALDNTTKAAAVVQEAVAAAVAAFHEWRNELLNNGAVQNYGNVLTTYDKREVHALNKMPSFIHDNDEELSLIHI